MDTGIILVFFLLGITLFIPILITVGFIISILGVNIVNRFITIK